VTVLETEAIVLSAFRYGETSKIVRLATRQFGVQSAIAKGALRPRSRFGAALQLLSRGQVQLIPARASDLHRLTAFDVLHVPVALASGLERYAAALAMAEVVQRVAPADPHPEVYEALLAALGELETVPDTGVGVAGLRGLWRLIVLLGFEPALDACVLDATLVPADVAAGFSVREGGVLCDRCGATHAVSRLGPADRRDLAALVSASAPLPVLDPPHEAAHRRLLSRFLYEQLAEGSGLPAVDFWQRRGWESAG